MVNPSATEDEPLEQMTRSLVPLLIVAGLAGVLVGLVGGSFHWLLTEGSSKFLALLVHWKSNGVWGLPGWLGAMLAVAISVALARWLVTFAPSAAGSGVQHVEAVGRGGALQVETRLSLLVAERGGHHDDVGPGRRALRRHHRPPPSRADSVLPAPGGCWIRM